MKALKVLTLIVLLLTTIKPIQVFFPVSSALYEKTYVNTKEGYLRYAQEYLALPVCYHGTAKTYMDWRKISATSRQGKYIRQNMIIKNGLLYDRDNYIGVALGSYFGKIGDRFVITLSTGIVLRLVKVEEKSDRHTNNGCEQKWDKSVIEFVIDPPTNKFYIGTNGLIANGNFNNIKELKGSIVEILKNK